MKKLLLKIKGYAILIFGGAKKVESFISEHVDDAVSIVETIKWLVENPVVITIMNIFPEKFGGKAKQVLERIQLYIVEVLSGLKVGEVCLTMPTLLEKMQCLVTQLKNMKEQDRKTVYNEMAVNYVRAVSARYTKDGQPMPESLARHYVEAKHLEISIAKMAGVKAAKEV